MYKNGFFCREFCCYINKLAEVQTIPVSINKKRLCSCCTAVFSDLFPSNLKFTFQVVSNLAESLFFSKICRDFSGISFSIFIGIAFYQ
jgi:hypothetical protein